KSLVKNFERTLANSTTKVNLCFVRLMLKVEVPLVAIVNFRGDKLYHEHIYWDQASVLVQIGKIDEDGLPVAGGDTAKKLLDETRPSNALMAENWKTSEGKPL
ncbi:MAG: hypothetical protein AAGI06_09065, partial [Pseudomonadota bacterium]